MVFPATAVQYFFPKKGFFNLNALGTSDFITTLILKRPIEVELLIYP